MKKLRLRREVIRLVDRDMEKVIGGGTSKLCTTAMSCTDPTGCIHVVTLNTCIAIATTAVDCP